MIHELLRKILPAELSIALDKLHSAKLYEIRLRSGSAVSVNYAGTYHYLSTRGITDLPAEAISLDADTVKQVVLHACDKSLYAVNDQICMGYLTIAGGIRIGIAGETVFEGNTIRTIKNFTALNIRIPHEVIGCAEKVIGDLRSPTGYYSTLIVSPPGAGKTTLLRDIARCISADRRYFNVLICDERNEIAAVSDGKPSLCVGRNSDVIAGSNKEYAFLRAIRSMRPDIIITDELCCESDVAAVENAIGSGVCVIASVHADSHTCLKTRRTFASLMENRYFRRYIDVSNARGVGTIEGIFDELFHPVCPLP